jgi:WD40 repeat protein
MTNEHSSGRVVFWRLDPTHRFEGAWAARAVGQPLMGHNGGVDSLDFQPHGSTLVTLSDDGRLRLWDVATRKLIGAPLPASAWAAKACGIAHRNLTPGEWTEFLGRRRYRDVCP